MLSLMSSTSSLTSFLIQVNTGLSPYCSLELPLVTHACHPCCPWCHPHCPQHCSWSRKIMDWVPCCSLELPLVTHACHLHCSQCCPIPGQYWPEFPAPCMSLPSSPYVVPIIPTSLMLTIFMCKLFLSFWIDVYVNFLYQNICMNYTHAHI